MKILEKKEKKLENALSKLKDLKLDYEGLTKNISFLENQKNQFKIEKEELQAKYKHLNKEHQNLKQQLEKTKSKTAIKFENQDKFDEKVDELNQETISLMEEIDKWQT